MGNQFLVLVPLLIAFAFLIPVTVNAVTSDEAQTNIVNTLETVGANVTDKIKDAVNNVTDSDWSKIDKYSIALVTNSSDVNDFSISLFNDSRWVPIVVNGTVVIATPPPPPPKEVCGDGIDNDGDGLVDEGCPIKPPEPSDKPSTNVNSTKTVRVVAIGDIDLNSGLDKQLALANKYNADILMIAGDYGYKDCQGVIDVLHKAGWTNTNSAIDQGNHDCANLTKQYNGLKNTYGYVTLNPQVDFMLIDANQDFKNNSAQYNALKDGLSSADAMYKVPVTHQPFVTVKSTHPPNGKFADYQPLFRGEGVDLVLQAHNHNYQRFNIDGITYLNVGIGTHDTGSKMYPLDSNSWEGFKCQKCITGTNGIVILDFKIDDPNTRQMNGWFIDMNENVKDKFN